MRSPGSNCRQVQTPGVIATIRTMNKGAWTMHEDEKLTDYIHKHGEGCWGSIPQRAGLFRCGKSCRLRWLNYLKPGLKRGNYGEDEEDLIIKLHALLGNRWSLIAGRLPGRTDNEVKNYWNSHLKRKLLKMGVDPSNHRLPQTLPRREEGNTNGMELSTSEATSRLSNKSTDFNQRVLVLNKGDRTCTSNQMSDSAGSCVLEDKWVSSNCLPDLNMDIEIEGLSSPSELGVDFAVKDKYQCCNNQSTLLREMEGAPHPTTLMLFT